jgi:hypothetical protein
MTEPFDTDDIAVGLHHFGAAASRHAQPPPVADIRRRAQRRRRGQIAGIAAGVALVALGAGAAVGNSGLMGNRTSGPVGPAASTHSTSEPRPTSTTTYGSKRYDTIPPDYPLLSFVDDPGGDGRIDGPAKTVPEVPIAPCGRRVWNPQGLIDSLTVRSNIPESPQIRQIVLFDDQAGAQDAISDVRDAFEACPVEQFDAGGFGVRHDISATGWDDASPPDVGQSSLGISSRSTYDQAPAIGLTEMRWVRLDNAVIFTFDSSEAMGDDTGPGREANQRVEAMVQAWCEAAGC